jgi:glycerol-3-phosphate O-acyltransferase
MVHLAEMTSASSASEAPAAREGVPSDPLSAMTPRYNLFFRWFSRRFFEHFQLDPKTVEQLRELESRGSVVFVMRYSSRLDYFLFNTLFQRVGLRLSSFANGLRFYYYRPVLQALRQAFLRPRARPRELKRSEEWEYARGITLAGGSFFLFLRTARLRSFWRGLRRRPRQDELDLLGEVVRTAWESPRPVYLVPLAVFWRKGPRNESRFLNLSYGSLTRPSDVAKVVSFLATYRDLSVKSGEPIDLRAFIDEHRAEGHVRVARKVRRSILTYLYREEKVVEGPTLRALHRVRDEVLEDSRVQGAIEERGRGKRSSPERARREAERIFREIAANMSSTLLWAISSAVTAIFRRMFVSIEVTGLDKVAECAKNHPIVLVPSHRSYFDFLIISWLFYKNFLVPPHIAARDNMAFGPFGFVFRRAGAFFLRRSFDDPLYKEVFRSYVGYLVREGLTQEFFIEGARSRTGKTMAPRLGMLAWDVEAFLASARRDLFLVPISITYERLVEESSMVDELQGGKKQNESTLGLVRARKYLRRRFGSVDVRFGEPISLARALGERRERFAHPEGTGEETQVELRHFVEELGLRLVERINWGAVANATSVAACVLLGSPYRGIFREELVRRMRQLVDLLGLQDVRFTAALQADREDFRESIAFLLRSDLVRSVADPRGEILYYEESKRRALDIYRNSICQFLATPSILARRLLRGGTRKELRDDLAGWYELLHQDYFAPRGELLAAHFEGFLDYFEGQGWIAREGEVLAATLDGVPHLAFLAEQTRGVIEAYHAVCTVALEEELMVDRKTLFRRARARFENMNLLGEAQRQEAANDVTFSNALDLLMRRGILEKRAAEKGRPGRKAEPLFARGERWEDLLPLRQRLAEALSAR